MPRTAGSVFLRRYDPDQVRRVVLRPLAGRP